ncbi:Cytochrome P450 714B3 [Dichanthelium oligosanthes]|uniref:Cytochrome P450 714B3 n=1 Tax=Dichanthelium oligosanthes TaxID=888268 RepID=A0A1E5UK20_9POAL|nr:Cytochrome P450 714B3 [Dichanthelium oligosanthes]
MEQQVAMAAVKVLLSLCCVGACGLAMNLYYILWLVPQRVLAEFRMQGISGPPPSFPYGNLADMREAVATAKAARASARRRPGGGGIVHDYRPAVLPYYEKWRKEHGPIFTYSMGNVVFLHVSRPDVVRDINLCVSLDLGKSSYLKATHEPLFGGGILKSNGEAWLHQRKIIAPEFFLDKVKGMVDLMVDSAKPLLKSWEERVDRNGGITDIKIDDDIRAYSADVISRTCFGSSYIEGKEIFMKIRELQQAVSKPNVLAEMTGLRIREHSCHSCLVSNAPWTAPRMAGPGAFVSRQALQDLKLGGVHIPKGVNIYIPVSTMHLDPKLWGTDAKEFNPERFFDVRPQLHSYLPFGAGARTCLGQGFAMAELKILISLIISKFVLKLSPQYEHSPTLKLIVEPELGVDLTLTKVQCLY